MSTREQWLNAALVKVREHIRATAGDIVPDTVRASCGFPGGGSARTRIGECWSPTVSNDQTTEIFISPVLADAGDVLAVLIHEAIHAAVGIKAGHKAPFKRCAIAAGLTGKMTATVASEALKPTLAAWSAELGPYPHAAMNLSGRKKQSTRLVKCQCDQCGYTVRTTEKWLTLYGAPLCPCSEERMRTA